MITIKTLCSLLGGVLGILVVMGLWIVLQGFVRRDSGCAADQDVLGYMAHGCGGCKGTAKCSKRKKIAGEGKPEGGWAHHELV